MDQRRVLIGFGVLVLAGVGAWLAAPSPRHGAADLESPAVGWRSTATLFPAIDGVPSGVYGNSCGFAVTFHASHGTVPPERLTYEASFASSSDVQGALPPLTTSSYVADGKLMIAVSATFAKDQLRDNSAVTIRVRVAATVGPDTAVGESVMPLNAHL